jgi:hypothetical protein
MGKGVMFETSPLFVTCTYCISAILQVIQAEAVLFEELLRAAVLRAAGAFVASTAFFAS